MSVYREAIDSLEFLLTRCRETLNEHEVAHIHRVIDRIADSEKTIRTAYDRASKVAHSRELMMQTIDAVSANFSDLQEKKEL